MPGDHTPTRRRVIQAAGAAGAAGLAGCFEGMLGDGTDTPSGGGDASDAVTGWAWDVAAEALATTVDPYEQQADAGVEVTIEDVGHDAITGEFRSALVSGSGAPEFAVLESVVAPTFVETGGLAELSDRIDADLRDAFVPGKWQAITGSDGGTYALPWDFGPVAVFYRRDVYEEHGIDPASIETWEQFVAAGERLPEGVAMANLPPNDIDGVWRRQFRQLGGEPFTDDGAVNVNSEASVTVARTIDRMADAEVAADVRSWGQDWFDRYREGTIASLPAGPWMEPVLRESLADTAGDWGVFPLPAHEAGGNRATSWGGSNLCIPEQTPSGRADRAWDYVEWAMTSPEMQNGMYEQFGVFPSLTDAYGADLYDEELAFFDGQAIRRTFADLAPDVPGYRYTVDTPAVSRAMTTYLGRMIDGELTPEAAVQEAAEEIAAQTGRDLA